MTVDVNEAFVETVEDLRRRCDLRATEYDMVQAAGLIRRLLIDGSALWPQVNRQFKTKPTVEWTSLRAMVRANISEQVMVAGLALDPMMAKAFITVNFPSDDADRLLAAGTRTGNFEKFLSVEVMDRKLAGQARQTATVRELIKHYANREGGVHYDPTGKSANQFIEQIRHFADEDLRMMIVACGRIVVRTLEPMAVMLTLKDKPWPSGLDFAYEPS